MTDVIESVAFRCPHCKRVYLSKRGAVIHAEQCFFNPERRSCFTCKPTGDQQDILRFCANGVDMSLYWCSVCGDEIDYYEGACEKHPNAKPLNGLRVQCDKWEVPA